MKRQWAIFWTLWGIAVACLLVGLVGTARAAGPVAYYPMLEPTGSTVLVDTSGHGHNGTIGAREVMGGSVHTYPAPVPAYDPTRIDTLPVYPDLTPGSRDVTVTVRMRSTMTGGAHLISWGQSPYNMIRIELSWGRLTCQWRGSGGFAGLIATGPYNDNRYHTLTCAKTATGVRLDVDGVLTMTAAKAVGALNLRTGLAIAGKRNCTGAVGHDCDYFAGQIDWVEVDEG